MPEIQPPPPPCMFFSSRPSVPQNTAKPGKFRATSCSPNSVFTSPELSLTPAAWPGYASASRVSSDGLRGMPLTCGMW